MGDRGRRGAVAASAMLGAAAVALALLSAPPSVAHVERTPLFQDPAPDTSIVPYAGGDFVRHRPYRSRRDKLRDFERHARRSWGPRGRRMSGPRRERLLRFYTRLDRGGQRRARALVSRLRRQRRGGPTPRALGLTDLRIQPETVRVVCASDSMRRLEASIRRARPSRRIAERARRKNRDLRRSCRHREIQEAVAASGNNDVVYVMPGFYTEPTSREQPHDDPRCARLVEPNETGSGAPTYEYHVTCPNDMALVAVLGRDLDGGCIRCNLQIEGTGLVPDDVVVTGHSEPRDPGGGHVFDFDELEPDVLPVKEVLIRADRADGLYVSNLTTTYATEHGIYANETDGLTLSRIKAFYAHEYGFLTFVTDHNLMKHLEAAGSRDAGIYPGASPPSRPRMNTVVTKSRAYKNVLGFSGTMGSNIRIVDNDFHDNAVGISLDSFYRAGHPGFPQHNTVIEDNRIHSNNFNPYEPGNKVGASVQAPVGTGVLIAGGNDNLVRGNRIYDNWRNGAMLVSVPDALSNNLDRLPELPEDLKLSTSHRNRFLGNLLGRGPDGESLPNGTDWWWDGMGNGNCWENGGQTSDPPRVPGCDFQPNVGVYDPVKAVQLAACAFTTNRTPGAPECDWFTTPRPPAR